MSEKEVLSKQQQKSKETKSRIFKAAKTILQKQGYERLSIKNICEDMLDGNISIAPYKNKDKNSCEFCEYSSVCQFDSSLKDNNYKIINKKSDDEIIKMMKEEVE